MKFTIKPLFLYFIVFMVICLRASSDPGEGHTSYSGIYPHLAAYNEEGECGTGAVVPWAGRLWRITYGPHFPFGSSDKLYEITPELEQFVRPESIGGTPANRMIHEESGQLFIGPYAIDEHRNVRVIPVDVMPGRLTGTARHLTDPKNKIYHATMEEGFYEVDVESLEVKTLYPDGNLARKEGQQAQYSPLLPGAHGKGLYSGQGVLVYTNNGEASVASHKRFDLEAGSLVEWDGKEWKLIRRNQFVEVTGPGDIYGNANPETDPIWATGWDYKSIILGVRDSGAWHFYRLPKASHSYDGSHGWNTEWPRIRNVGIGEKKDFLMTMHGMFWKFPETFCSSKTAGIRPRSAYLKVIGDFTRWNDQLVFGCDDSAQKEFLNKRKAKGGIEGPGQSNSNLWFTPLEKPDQLGPATAEGAVWISEKVDAGEVSEPFLFAGWDTRSAWIQNDGEARVTFLFEVDDSGDNEWTPLKSIDVEAGGSARIPFGCAVTGEWVRVRTDTATTATVHFFYGDTDTRGSKPDPMFDGLAGIEDSHSSAGLLWGLGDNRRALGILAGVATDDGFEESGYYELDGEMRLVRKNDPETAAFIRETFAIPRDVVTVDKASVLVIDDKGRRWRLPKGNEKYGDLVDKGLLRICREVATERDLFNCSGTFYELPAENADGYAKIRPVASHDYRIHDYASYRGLLVMTGLDGELPGNNPHIIRSDDGKLALWVGAIDDLWKMGRPTGTGGPWKDSNVQKQIPSDPYLIGFYENRTLELSHASADAVTFTIEVEPIGHGPWMTYKIVTVQPGECYSHVFPKDFHARWIRFTASEDCQATAWLTYE